MNIFTKLFIPVAIAAGGLVVTVGMVQSAKSAQPVAPEAQLPSVLYVEVSTAAHAPLLEAKGSVEAAREMSIVPQVSGQVISVSPEMVVGGRFEKGQTMVKVDPRDYRNAVEQQKNQVEQANLGLKIEEGKANVARREWTLLSDKGLKTGESRVGALAKREPHQQAAKFAVKAAKSALGKAKLDLERTVIRAPFNGTVVSESVEVGQVLGGNSTVATFIGTDEVWVRVAVPVEYLRLLSIPDDPASGEGSMAHVKSRLRGGQEATWSGRVIRLIKQMDSESRTAQVLVEIKDPFDPAAGELPLLPGAFVSVELSGNSIAETVALSRRGVTGGRYVWLVDSENRLRRRELDIRWGTTAEVFVRSGLSNGDRVVLDPAASLIEGMEVRADTGGDDGGARKEVVSNNEPGKEG